MGGLAIQQTLGSSSFVAVVSRGYGLFLGKGPEKFLLRLEEREQSCLMTVHHS